MIVGGTAIPTDLSRRLISASEAEVTMPPCQGCSFATRSRNSGKKYDTFRGFRIERFETLRLYIRIEVGPDCTDTIDGAPPMRALNGECALHPMEHGPLFPSLVIRSGGTDEDSIHIEEHASDARACFGLPRSSHSDIIPEPMAGETHYERKVRIAGLPTGVYWPVNVSRPLSRWILNEVILSLRWLHT